MRRVLPSYGILMLLHTSVFAQEYTQEDIERRHTTAYPISRLQRDWIYQDHGLKSGDCFVAADGHSVERTTVRKVLAELKARGVATDALQKSLAVLVEGNRPGNDLPDWLKQGPAQVRFGREWLGQPERIEAWLEKYWTKHFEGVPLIVTFWGWEGVATWVPPQYFPPYPSEDGLKRCVDAVKRAGGHAFFWPSGYQWCLSYGKREDGSFEWEDRARFEREAKPHAIIGKDGKVMLTNPRWYRGGEAATLCRGDKWSRDWLTGVAVGLAERGGELFQIDQVVGAGMRGGGDCRAATHGHPLSAARSRTAGAASSSRAEQGGAGRNISGRTCLGAFRVDHSSQQQRKASRVEHHRLDLGGAHVRRLEEPHRRLEQEILGAAAGTPS